jgi:hypothetical protein
MGVGNLESGGLVGSLGMSEKGMVYPYGFDAFRRFRGLRARGVGRGVCGAVSDKESGTKRAVWAGVSIGGSEHAESIGGSN